MGLFEIGLLLIAVCRSYVHAASQLLIQLTSLLLIQV